MAENENPMVKRSNSLVAATFEKANTYVFAAPIIRDREVGGSNPLAPTIIAKENATRSEWLSCSCYLIHELTRIGLVTSRKNREFLSKPISRVSSVLFADPILTKIGIVTTHKTIKIAREHLTRRSGYKPLILITVLQVKRPRYGS